MIRTSAATEYLSDVRNGGGLYLSEFWIWCCRTAGSFTGNVLFVTLLHQLIIICFYLIPVSWTILYCGLHCSFLWQYYKYIFMLADNQACVLVCVHVFALHCYILITLLIYFRKNKSPEDPSLDLLCYRREVIQTYLRCYTQPRPTAGPRGRLLPAKRRISSDIRTDHLDHYMSHFDTQRRCGECHKNTRKGCRKCGVGLHDHCFESWRALG